VGVHKLEITPGVVKDDTPLSAEGGWIDADKVRFRRGRPEAIGGWEKLTTDLMTGVARGSLTWPTLTGEKVVAWGTQSKLQALIGGELRDITPPHSEHVLFNPFATVNGSTTVTVSNAVYTAATQLATTVPHGLKAGDSVTFDKAAAVGGLTLNGTFSIATIPSSSTFTITAGSSATSTASGGGFVVFTATLAAGNLDGSGTSGYGVSTYGNATYGAAFAGDSLPRIWSLSQWGEFMLANPSGYGLYEFQPALSYPNLVTNGDFGSSTGWTLGTGWSIGSGVLTKTGANATSATTPLSADIKAGYTYRLTFTLTRTAGTVKFVVADNITAPLSVAGTYSLLFRCPSGATTLAITADASFAGTLDNVAISLENKAYRVIEAPAVAYGMFVDSNRIVVLMSTINAAGVFDPLLVRWSGLENNRTWVPDSANIAGEIQLAAGSRAVGGVATRAQNVIWTDSTLYRMQFTGDTTDVFSVATAGEGCGLLGPLAAIEQGGVAYWMANTGQFFRFAGGAPEIIPCPLKKDVFDNLAPNQEGKSFCWVNSKFGEVWFHYADARDGNECSRYAVFNFVEQHWTAGTMARTSFVGAGVFANPIGFGADNLIYSHEKGASADGAPLATFIKSAPFDIEDGENLMAVRRLAPEFKDQQGAVQITLKGRSFPPDTEISAGPYLFSATTRYADTRFLSREISVTISSEAAPSSWRLGTFSVEGTPTAAKR
jgi:hypothetical protein